MACLCIFLDDYIDFAEAKRLARNAKARARYAKNRLESLIASAPASLAQGGRL